jgi:hypothetical protein
VPATTEDRLTTTTVPNGTAQIGQLNAPSTPIERAMGGGIPNLPGVQYTPSNDPTSREVAARINHPPAVPNLSPTQVPLVKQELGIKRLNVPAYYDASRDAAVQRRGAIADQTARTHADAYEAAGLSHEDAMAAAQNPALARSLLAPHNKKVYFDADGVPTVVDAQDPQFPAGFRARRLGMGTRASSRDPNISAAAATEHAIVETSKETAAGNKAIPKLAPFSINPQADSASVIGARTPLLGRLGELAIRRDSLQHSYDQEAGAINSGRTASGAVDMSGPRAELERRRQQMEAIVANPNAPLAVKARAQDLYRQHVESLGLSPLTPATPATGARP